MFSLKSFLTYLSRNRLYTIINIFGFAASLTFVVLMSLYLERELSVDSSLPSRERMYRLEDTKDNAFFAAKTATDLESRYPQIEKTLRLYWERLTATMTDNSKSAKVTAYADSTLFDFYPVKFIEGDAISALKTIDCVVLSKEFAQQQYGSTTNALGKTIKLNDNTYTVSAVIEIPNNTSLIWKDLIIPFQNIKHIWNGFFENYNASTFPTLVMMREGTSIDSTFIKECTEYYKGLNPYFAEDDRTLRFTPIKDVYWSNLKYITQFETNSFQFISTIALCVMLVLAFAVFNYVNLTVTQTQFRAKEAATRRLLGGTKTQLFFNFIIESLVLCFISLALATFFAYALQKEFNMLMESSISVANILTPLNVAISLLLLIVLSVISGVIPAIAITRYKPIQVVRGDFKRRSKMVYSRVLIGVQYFVTIVMLGVTYTINQQTDYMLNSDMGFNPKNLMVVYNSFKDLNRMESLAQALSKVSGVEKVSLTQGVPFAGQSNLSFTIENDKSYSYTTFAGDSLYMDLLGLEIISRTGNANPNAVWINEAAAKKIGLKEGDIDIPWGNENGKMPLAGVVRNFHYISMTEEVTEAIVTPLKASVSGTYPWMIAVKTSGGDAQQMMAEVEREYKDFTGGEPFYARMLDEIMEAEYVRERQISMIVSVLSILALIISAMGILAMSTYFIKQKTKEMAVRKVFGSTNSEIFIRLIKLFIILLIVAFAVATPVIYLAAQRYLADFTYHIPITPIGFIIAGMITLATALTTISWKALEAMRTNPARVIKSE